MLTHKPHTHTHTHTHALNVSLSIRVNGTEHLHFLIRELKLSYLNVSPSIVAAHHFHSNPPQRNELELLSVSPPPSPPPSTPPALIGASTFRRTGMVLIWRRCVTTLMCPSHDFCFETGYGAIITVYTHSKKRRLGRRAENCAQPVDGRAGVCINERRSRAPMCTVVVAAVLHVHVNVHVHVMALRRR